MEDSALNAIMFFILLVGFFMCFLGVGSGNLGVFFVGLLMMFSPLVILIFSVNNDDKNNMENTYLVYRAWDDGEISSKEMDAFKYFEGDVGGDLFGLLEEFEEDPDNKKIRERYEAVVNRIIDVSDGTKNKTKFKNYVVERELETVLKSWDDELFDDRELELIGFAKDVSGEDYLDVVDRLENNKESSVLNALYKDMIEDISKRFEGIEAEGKVVNEGNKVFKLDK